MEKKRQKINWNRGITRFVFMSLVVSIVYIVFEMATAPAIQDLENPFGRVKSDYALILLQCILGVFAMLLPGFLRHQINLVIPSKMLVVYTVFLYCAIYLGEVRSFYYMLPHWDTILHAFSGAMLGALGFSFINFLNKTEAVPINLSPIFVVTFAFCFAVTLGVLWEVYEFLVDGFFGTNMQKFALEDRTILQGRSALIDTMKDLIVDMAGAFVMSLVGYISLKYKKGWLENVMLKIQKHG